MTKIDVHKYSFRKTFFINILLGMASMFGQSLFILADTFFIANGIVANGIASLNIVLPIVNIINGLGWMLGVGGATLFSIFKNQDEKQTANEKFTYTVVFAGFTAIIFSIIFSIYSHNILIFLGAKNSIYQMAKDYYDVIVLFSIFFILNNTFITFLRNDGNAKLAMIGFSAGGIVNIILDYLFIFPMDMGIRGAAIATVISPMVSLIILSFHRKNKARNLSFTTFKKDFQTAYNIVSIGFSAFLNEFSSAFVMFLFNVILLRLVGNTAIAAYGIIANINIIAIALLTGLGQGIQPVASSSFGTNNQFELTKIVKYGLFVSVFLGTLIFLINLFFSQQIISIFNNQENIQLAVIADTGLKIYFSSFLFTGINFFTTFFMAAVNRPRPSLIISLLRGLILIVPTLFLLSHYFGLIGVWLTMPIVEIITGIVSIATIHNYIKNI